MAAKSGNELVFAFRDQSPSFVHGFTCGRIWQQFRTRTDPFSETIASEIREDVIALATAAGWMEEFLPADEAGEWLYVTFLQDKQI